MKWNRLMATWGIVAMASLTAVACSDDTTTGPGGEDNPPSAVTNLQVTVNGQTVAATWSAASGADEYVVTLLSADENDRTQTVATTTAQWSGLTPSTTYSVRVVASNDDGDSPAMTSNLVTTDEVEETVVQVTGDILGDVTWTADKTWVLNQPIFVGVDCGADGSADGCVSATLTIEPGTTVVGRTDIPQGVRGAYLVVSRGSRLVADATGGVDRAPTAEEVIVFTSNNPRGSRARGDWGGLVINGAAPTNSGDEAEGEGDSGFYGGTDDMDDSGILRGVRIEYAGDDVTPADQLNGLALQGVGAGTTISYLQIHHNTDDGIEPFGGTVSVDHLVVTGIGDDSVDGTDGYRGFMQFIIGQQIGDDADQGMELSNNGDTGNASPKSTAVVANATMIGAGSNVVDGTIAGAESDNGIQLREGTNYRVYNTIFTGFGESGFCIRDAQSLVNAQNRLNGQTDPTTTLSAEGIIMWNNQGADDSDDNFAACGGGSSLAFNKQFFENAGFNNMLADPGFDDSAFDVGSQSSPPDFTLAAMPNGYTAFDLSTLTYGTNLVMPEDGRTLVDTDYAGAIEPGTDLASAWYVDWTIWSTDGADSRPNADGN